MGRRSEHSRDELKAMILAAALRLVREQGEAALTARNIARAIGYTPGMLYHIFPNQDAMVQALAEALLGSLLARLTAALQGQQGRAAMQCLGREYIAFATGEAALWRLIWNYPYAEGHAGAARPVGHQAAVQGIFALAETALREQHTDWDATRRQNALQAWLSGLQGVAMLGITGRLHLLPEVTVESVAEALTHQFAE